MKLRVLFFAYLRERCGREAEIDAPEDASVGDVWALLRGRYPVLDDVTVRFAVNRVYVDKAHRLQDNDELALIPPVSGGT